MSSMSSVAGLSKYITTLPKTEKSITAMFIISFISGAVYFIINPSPELGMVENIILGGLFSLIILGISSIIGGGVNQQIVSGLHGINLKIKHSMFLSALSMTIVCILLIIGGILTHFIETDFFLNSLLFGCVLIYGVNTLVFWTTSKISFTKAATVGIIQPLIMLAMYVLITFLEIGRASCRERV